MIDAPPGDVGDVQQAVDAAQIDEGAVIGDVLDHAGEDLPFLQRGDQLRARLGAALLEHGAARDDDVAARAVHLEDLERLRRAQERRDVAHRADIDLAARQERDGAVEIDGEAALDPAEDRAGDALVRLEILLELGPGFLAPRLLARDLRLAVLVLHALEIDLDDVAGLDLGRLARRRRIPSSGTRPSDLRPTSISTASFSTAITVPLMTVPSSPAVAPSNSSSSAAKLSLPWAGRVWVATAIRTPALP